MKKLILLSVIIGFTYPETRLLAGFENQAENKEQPVINSHASNNNNATPLRPIFGKKLVHGEVLAAIMAIKDKLPAIEVSEGTRQLSLPQEIIFTVLSKYLTDKTIDGLIRSNVALEFLADPMYQAMHHQLLTLIESSDLPLYVFPLAVALGYDQTVQRQLYPSISPGISTALKLYFSSYPMIKVEEEIWLLQFKEALKTTGIEEDCSSAPLLLSNKDLLSLLHHIVSLNPKCFGYDKMKDLLISFKRCVVEAKRRKLDLNFENEQGLTPLMWTATLHPFWLDNEYTAHLRRILIRTFADLSAPNKLGESFLDIYPAKQQLKERLFF